MKNQYFSTGNCTAACTHHLFICLFIRPTPSYPFNHTPTRREQSLPQWHSHSRQGEIPTLPNNSTSCLLLGKFPFSRCHDNSLVIPDCSSGRVFPHPHRHSHTTHTHSYIFIIMWSDSISQPIKLLRWFDVSYCQLICSSLGLNTLFNMV